MLLGARQCVGWGLRAGLGRVASCRLVGAVRCLSGMPSSWVLVHNSLNGREEPLVAVLDEATPAHVLQRHRPRLTWYMCGPTVYDDAHLGHARTYTCFDIVHRVLTDYFGVDVSLAVGITDVDDKILARAASLGVSPGELARKFERDFRTDMDRLGIKRPSAFLRVSDHIPEILAYIQGILDNGCAYVDDADGSVYFDVTRFERDHGFKYGKLRPAAFDAFTAVAEEAGGGEGNDRRRHPADFALWKGVSLGSADTGPSAVAGAGSGAVAVAVGADQRCWESPWGIGRPGWHIECSALSDVMFGSRLDLHTGGIDLKFPHHNNEVAQCNARNCSHEWARVFMHSGHLHIAGRKMSKSLKNFISIREFLQHHTADKLRMFCLMHRYSSSVEYSEERMVDAGQILKRFRDFFQSCEVFSARQHSQKWRAAEWDMRERWTGAMHAVDQALRDDFDTPKAVSELLALVACTNQYIAAANDPEAGGSVELVQSVAADIRRMLGVFGLDAAQELGRHHHHSNSSSRSDGDGDGGGVCDARSGVSHNDLAAPLVRFRQQVRRVAKNVDVSDGELRQSLLALCDHYRDEVLRDLGIMVRDLDGVLSEAGTESGASWTWLTDEELTEHRRHKEARRQLLEERQAASREKATREAEQPVLLQPPSPAVMFQPPYCLDYAQFDETGLPTHTADGTPLSKTARKKLLKRRAKEERKHERTEADRKER